MKSCSGTRQKSRGGDDFIVFHDSTIEDGTLLVMTRLVYAPDGGTVVIVEDEIPAEPESAEAVPDKGTEGAANP